MGRRKSKNVRRPNDEDDGASSGFLTRGKCQTMLKALITSRKSRALLNATSPLFNACVGNFHLAKRRHTASAIVFESASLRLPPFPAVYRPELLDRPTIGSIVKKERLLKTERASIDK